MTVIDKENIRKYWDKFKGDNGATVHPSSVICPYCGHEEREPWGVYSLEIDEPQENKCPYCKKAICITAETTGIRFVVEKEPEDA